MILKPKRNCTVLIRPRIIHQDGKPGFMSFAGTYKVTSPINYEHVVHIVLLKNASFKLVDGIQHLDDPSILPSINRYSLYVSYKNVLPYNKYKTIYMDEDLKDQVWMSII